MKKQDKLRKLKDRARCVSDELKETTASKAGRVRDAVGDAASSTRVSDAVSTGKGVVRDAAKRVSETGNAATQRLGLDSSVSFIHTTGQALLASNLSTEINSLVQNVVAGSPTIYDKAMDASYITSHIGGAQHRLFDGGHTIIGAFRAGHAASPDDNIIQEAMGTIQGLLRDVSTPNGLPLANWDYDTYQRVAETLESKFFIPKSWFYDLNTYDAADLLGGAIGTVAVLFHWNRGDTEEFAKLVGGMGLSAVLSANPLLLIVTVVAMARSFHIARRSGEYTEFVDGQIKGVAGAGATIGAVTLVGVAGGPWGVALIAGLVAGILVNQAMKDVSVVEVGQVVAKQATVTASEAKRLMRERYVEDPNFGSVTVTF
ncbi:MAG: hypothetical protein OXD46_16065 [Chloroflexi bacterium]|nr:hypothetical protein [Chloroflexota bacterium]